MTDLALLKPSPGSTAEALLYFLVVFLLLCLSIALLGFKYGGLLCAQIWLAYVISNVYSAKQPVRRYKSWRRRMTEDLEECRRSYKSWRWIRGELEELPWNLGHICLSVVMAAIIIVFLNAVFFIFPNEFNILLIPGADSYFEIGSLELPVLAVLLFVLASAFGSLGAFEDPGDGRGRWVRIRDRVGKRWTVALFWQMLIAAAAGLALCGILVAIVLGLAIGALTSSANLSWGQHAYSVLIGYPTLLLMLAGAAVALVSHRGLAHQYADSLPRVTQEGATSDWKPLRAKFVPIIALLLVGAVAMTFGQVKAIRAGTVTVYAGFPMGAYLVYANQAIHERIAKSVDRGLSAEALVAELNEQGQWSSENPGQGFLDRSPELGETSFEVFNLPADFRETYFEILDDLRCTIRVVAGTLSEQERAATAQLDLAMDAMPIKFCLRTVCRWPRLEVDYSVTFLRSSHPSEREGWDRGLTTTLLFDRIHASGGFCTASGDLADGYQG